MVRSFPNLALAMIVPPALVLRILKTPSPPGLKHCSPPQGILTKSVHDQYSESSFGLVLGPGFRILHGHFQSFAKASSYRMKMCLRSAFRTEIPVRLARDFVFDLD
jgi:hypothetical protein